MIYKLEKINNSTLEIRVNDKKKEVKVFSRSRQRIGAAQDLKSKMVRAVTGLSTEEQREFEKKLYLAEETLIPTSKYWYTWGVYITELGTFLDTEYPEDELAIKVLLARGDVASSSIEAAADKVKYQYVLKSEETEAIKKTEDRDIKIKAFLLYDGMNSEQMREFLITIGENPINMSDKIVRERVGDLAEREPKKFLSMADHPYKKEIHFINELVNHAVLKRHNKQILTIDNHVIAYNEAEMIKFLKDSANSQIIVGYKKQLKENKKG
jgi:hypothetical protein